MKIRHLPCDGGPWDGQWLTHDRSTRMLLERHGEAFAELGTYVVTDHCWKWVPFATEAPEEQMERAE